MTLRTVLSGTLTALLVCAGLITPGHAQARRLRVAVYPFNQSSVQINIQKEVGSNINYGEVVADMLATELATTFDVINRDQIAKLLEEQGRKYDERFDQSAAPEFGKLLGVDAIVTGSLTAFNVEQKTDEGIGGKINSGLGALGKKPMANTSKTTLEANVELNAQIISTVTGKTLVAAPAKGHDHKEVEGSMQVVATQSKSPTTSTTTRSGYDPYIRTALHQAVQQVTERFASTTSSAPRLDVAQPAGTAARPSAPATEYVPLPDELGNVRKLDGRVLSFFLAPGVKLAVGDVLAVQHAESTVNPRTGKEVLVGETIGMVTLTVVQGETAQGTYEGKPVTDKDRVVKK
jgi:curli biogenesis system outer membrane secretion channel CsgG